MSSILSTRERSRERRYSLELHVASRPAYDCSRTTESKIDIHDVKLHGMASVDVLVSEFEQSFQSDCTATGKYIEISCSKATTLKGGVRSN